MRIIRKRTIIVWIIEKKGYTRKVKNINNNCLNNISINETNHYSINYQLFTKLQFIILKYM